MRWYTLNIPTHHYFIPTYCREVVSYINGQFILINSYCTVSPIP